MYCVAAQFLTDLGEVLRYGCDGIDLAQDDE
jgi:hypothetical protein